MTETSQPNYSVRRFQPEDAPGIAACVRLVYGDSYLHHELYEPEQIVRQNQTGELVSVVAVATDGRVVGHYALERPDLGRIAEEGEALVLPECRHHHLMESMRELLETEAHRVGLSGLFGWAVTNHVFSQKTHERFGLVPTAISLGALPRSFHNMPEPLPQRLSLLLGFKYLRKPTSSVANLPQQHQTVCAQIYDRVGLVVDIRNGTKPNSPGQISVHPDPSIQTLEIRVDRVGPETPAEVQAALRGALEESNTATVFLELPLEDPGTPVACAAAEAAGFFFSGIGPSFAPKGDVLRLQYLTEPLDISLVQIDSPLARELIDYVDLERRRVQDHKQNA